MSEHSEDPGDAAARRIELATRILGLTYALVSILYLIWVLIPGHRRRLMAMAVMARTSRVTGTLASRTGQQAMHLEIVSGAENYAIPYVLSVARDNAARLYERLRYTA